MNRSYLRYGLLFIVITSLFLLALRIYNTTTNEGPVEPTRYGPPAHTFVTPTTDGGEQNTGPWVERSYNWQKCIDHTKEYADRNLPWEPMPYPEGNLASVNGCVVVLVGSALGYQEEFKRGLKSFDKNFNDIYHYPIFAFHFNLLPEAQLQIQASTKSKITFITIKAPNATEPVSVLNSEPIGYQNSGPYSFPLEYRFQTYFFMETIFQHEALQGYNYVLRIDNDIDIVKPINYDPFKFMESNGFVLNYHHWSIDPLEICSTLYAPTHLYQKQMGKYLDAQHDRPIPPQCYCGGGALFIAYAPFFRSPQFKAYWEYIKCLGGVWTNRWAEQNLFPIALSLMADNPERRIFLLSNFPVTHKQELLQPHESWGLPNWPQDPQSLPENAITDLSNAFPKHFLRACVVYYAGKDDIDALRRSLTNLEYHFLWEYPYPVFIFHQDLGEKEQELISTALDKNIALTFVKVELGKEAFFLTGMFEQAELKDFAYFLRMGARTNVVADIYWDILRFIEEHNFTLAYHRYRSPVEKLEPPLNDQLWDIVASNYQSLASKLPPKGFYYSLEYFAVGSFDFFRSNEYLAFAKKLPEGTRTSHAFPIAISLFQDEPWKTVGDLTELMINWDTTSKEPFFHKAWWYLKQPIPTWGFKFSNRDPPAV